MTHRLRDEQAWMRLTHGVSTAIAEAMTTIRAAHAALAARGITPSKKAETGVPPLPQGCDVKLGSWAQPDEFSLPA